MVEFLFWPGIFTVSIILGLFLKPKTVAISAIIIMIIGISLYGFFSNLKDTDIGFMYGVGAMISPVIFGVVFVGAVLGEKIKNMMS